MNRLVVYPGTPQAWEILLKPGINLIGRGFSNDFKIGDPSVSGTHCQVIVAGNSVTLKDLGSTNGTFVNRAQIQEATLKPGQTITLGSVEMLYQIGDPVEAPIGTVTTLPVAALAATAPAALVTEPPPPVVAASAAPQPRLRISSISHEPPAPVAAADEPPPMLPPEPPAPTAFIQNASRFCKFHPKSPARYLCPKCNRSFCEMCVTSRATGGVPKKLCRTCGVDLMPLQVQAARQSADGGFFSRLPGVLIYPFKGGALVFIASVLVFTVLNMISGVFSILLTIAAIGYLFTYMQQIIHSTAAGENEMPPLPPFEDLFSACFRLLGTVLMSFWLAAGLLIARLCDVPIPAVALLAATILGCVYFPMAFLAVAMKDNVASSNPLVVIPAMLKVPLEYIVTVILFGGVFALRQLGEIVGYGAKEVTYSTREMSTLFIAFGIGILWSCAKMYLLVINMRLLGLLYLTKKHKFGWFSH